MTFLPSLLQKIENFHRLATILTKYGQAYVMPDDPEEDAPEIPQAEPSGPGLYPRIIAITNEFSSQDIADEIRLIAEMYRKAIDINGGYNLVNRALSTALSNMDSLIDEGTVGENELEQAENILNEVSRDLRQRAKTPGQINEATAMRELKAARDAFNQQAIYQEVAAQPTVYEKGRPGKETGHGLPDRPEPKTPQQYALEMERLQDMEKDPANQSVSGSIRELISVLEQLIEQLPLTKQLQDDLKITPEDQAKKTALDQAAVKLSQLREQRKRLKDNMRRALQSRELRDLQERMNTTSNPEERKWLQKKIELQELRLSKDLRKGTEIKYLKGYIDKTGVYDEHGVFHAQPLSPEAERTFLEGIKAGKEKKKTPAEIGKETAELSRQLKKTLGPTYTKEERAKKKQEGFNTYDWANMQLANFTEHLEKSILAKRKTFKDAVLKTEVVKITEAEKEQRATLKPFIDNVATAANNKKDIGPALIDLKKQLRKVVLNTERYKLIYNEMIIFLLSIRISKLLYNFRDQLKEINNWLGTPRNKKERIEFIPDFSLLSPEQVESIKQVINTGKNLVSRFESYKAKIPFKTHVSPGESPPSSWGGDTPTIAINIVKKIVDYLEYKISNLEQ